MGVPAGGAPMTRAPVLWPLLVPVAFLWGTILFVMWDLHRGRKKCPRAAADRYGECSCH